MKHMLHFVACPIAAVLISAVAVLADQPPPAPAAPAPVDAAAVPTDGPRIKFDSDIFDAGNASAGQPLNHTFVFTNVGNQTLEVTKVNPTCGCTVAGTWTRKVEPGQTGTIPLSINVNPTWSGQMAKVVTVESNDKTKPPSGAPLTIKFTVWKPIEISQQYVFLNIPAEATNDVSTVVRIDNKTDQPMAIYDAHSPSPAMVVQIKTNVLGTNYELVVKAVPPFKQASGVITARTSLTNMPLISINSSVNIQPAVWINPPAIALEPPPLTNVVQKPVTIQYMGSSSLRVSNAVFSAKGVDVQVNETQPGRVFTVTLSFPPGFEANGKPMELLLNSSSPQMPVIKIPVNQQPRVVHPVAPVKPAAASVTPVQPPQAARVNAP
jgi:hypothetical protein